MVINRPGNKRNMFDMIRSV